MLNDFIVEVEAVESGTFFLARRATVKSFALSVEVDVEVDVDVDVDVDNDGELFKFVLFDMEVWEQMLDFFLGDTVLDDSDGSASFLLLFGGKTHCIDFELFLLSAEVVSTELLVFLIGDLLLPSIGLSCFTGDESDNFSGVVTGLLVFDLTMVTFSSKDLPIGVGTASLTGVMVTIWF